MRTWTRAAGPTRSFGVLAAFALTALAACADSSGEGLSGQAQPTPAAKESSAEVRRQQETRDREQAEARAREQADSLARCPKTARACVDEHLRISWLQRDGTVIWGPVPILPGTPEMPGAVATPKGVFRVKWKDADHISNEYHEPMPNAVFFTSNGIAFHGGALTGGSHGCVHLSPVDSDRYFKELSRGSQVAVF